MKILEVGIIKLEEIFGYFKKSHLVGDVVALFHGERPGTRSFCGGLLSISYEVWFIKKSPNIRYSLMKPASKAVSLNSIWADWDRWFRLKKTEFDSAWGHRLPCPNRSNWKYLWSRRIFFGFDLHISLWFFRFIFNKSFLTPLMILLKLSSIFHFWYDRFRYLYLE